MNWLISANSSMYKHASSFEHHGFIDWRQGNTKYKKGDIIFIYCTRPVKSIRYKCKVEEINLRKHEIRDDKEYWKNLEEYYKSLDGNFMKLRLIDQIENTRLNLDNLKLNGLKAAPQGPKKLVEYELLNYINENFSDDFENENFPETVREPETVYEGVKKQVTVNKYERSSLARSKCIEYHGTTCKVCSMNFEEVYGEIGKGFIHVHHLIPISQIGKEYKVDYKKDLIPVCPNCHAMLHKKISGKEPTIEELKKTLKTSDN